MNSTLVGVFTITLVFLSAFVNLVGGSTSSQCLPSPVGSNPVQPCAQHMTWESIHPEILGSPYWCLTPGLRSDLALKLALMWAFSSLLSRLKSNVRKADFGPTSGRHTGQAL